MSKDSERIFLRTSLCLAVTLFGGTDEHTKELLQEYICGVLNMSSCVSCVHLSRVKEPLVSM